MIILGLLLGALSNVWAGYKDGDRYTGGLLMAIAGAIATGDLIVSLALGIGFIAWRLPGWQKALDIGRNPGEVDPKPFKTEKQRDTAMMFAIALIPAITLSMSSMNLLGLLLAPLIALSYYGAMWWLPWEPKYPHIKVAEAFSGIAFVLTAAMVA